jgi:hypothetical protein
MDVRDFPLGARPGIGSGSVGAVMLDVAFIVASGGA